MCERAIRSKYKASEVRAPKRKFRCATAVHKIPLHNHDLHPRCHTQVVHSHKGVHNADNSNHISQRTRSTYQMRLELGS
jgi:hypothetical protein